jgi:short-subunit dehydrogenase
MGKLYAFFFAKAGFNLALSSFNKDQLLDVKKELNDKYPDVEVYPYVVDYSKTTDYSEQTEFKDLKQNLRVVINNVGVLKKIPYLEDTPAFIQTSIKVNLYPFFLYTKLAINAFKKQAEDFDQDEGAKKRFGIL